MEEKQNKKLGWVMLRLKGSLLFGFFSILISISSPLTNYAFSEDKNLVDVELIDLDGNNVSLRNFKDQVTIVLFWASWCPTCVDELKNFELYYQTYKNEGLNIIAVGMDDSLERIKEFREKNKITFSLVADNNQKAKEAFDVAMLPTLIIFNREGKITKIRDPETGKIVERMMGARDWGGKEFRESLLGLLKIKSNTKM